MISALALQWLVLPAIVIAALAPVLLIYLVLRDARQKRLW